MGQIKSINVRRVKFCIRKPHRHTIFPDSFKYFIRFSNNKQFLEDQNEFYQPTTMAEKTYTLALLYNH